MIQKSLKVRGQKFIPYDFNDQSFFFLPLFPVLFFETFSVLQFRNLAKKEEKRIKNINRTLCVCVCILKTFFLTRNDFYYNCSNIYKNSTRSNHITYETKLIFIIYYLTFSQILILF